MTTNEFNTIAITRQIRDSLYEHIKDMTQEERLTFFRDRALAYHRKHKLPIGLATPGTGEPAASSPRVDGQK